MSTLYHVNYPSKKVHVLLGYTSNQLFESKTVHELVIAQSILTTLEREASRQNLPAVKAVGVRIGTLSDIVPDALRFNFEVIKQDTPFAQTDLIIESVSMKAQCTACQHEFEVKSLLFVCPSCDSGQVRMTQGEELDIAYLEVED